VRHPPNGGNVAEYPRKGAGARLCCNAAAAVRVAPRNREEEAQIMKTLQTMACVSLLLLSGAVLAQHEHHGGADAAPASEAVASAPDAAAAGKGGGMSHGGKKGHGGMGCPHLKGGGADVAELERRINELEKRLDLMQLLLQRESR
jgi:hypothetical protein